MLTLLIDADSLVYEACRANEVEIDWGDDLWTLHGNLAPTMAHFRSRVADLQETLEAQKVIMALSDYTDPWRRRVMPSYKSNRKNTRKPVTFNPLREFVHEEYVTFQRPGLEGDDVLGILGTSSHIIDGAKITVSLDKDMGTIPGEHYRLHKSERFSVTEADADRYHMVQTLSGDSTDGYPGCPGIGKVRAERLMAPLTGYAEMWPVVVATYVKAGLNEQAALDNARVARICRIRDYDLKTKEVRLWTPPRT